MGRFQVIQVVFEEHDGRFYAHSDDLPGLHLVGPDRSEIEESIAPAIVALFKEGYDIAVEVYPDSDLPFSSIRHPSRFVAAKIHHA